MVVLLVRSKSKISPSRFGLCAFRDSVGGFCFPFTARGTLNDYLTDILLLMESSKWKLNADKTDPIITDTKQRRNKIFSI